MRNASDVSIPSIDVSAMRDVLDDAPVSVAVLYGSHARGEATARSDVDVAIGFSDSLSSVERTQARLDLIERLGAALDVDAVDAIPLSGASDSLQREIRADGVLLHGSEGDLASYGDPGPASDSHDDRMAEFDEVLAELERVV